MICGRVELNPMDGLFQLKFLNYFIVSVVYDVESSLLTSRNNVVSFATDCVYI